jgi:autotransporter passenger strand-loop-strand repeat protein
VPVSPSVTSVDDSLIVESGGTAISASILGGGEQISGTDISGTLTSHGFQGVSSGGLASATFVDDGAVQTIQRTGSASAVLVAKGGTELVACDGTAHATTVTTGGFVAVSAGGTATFLTLSSGGTAVLTGANANGSTYIGLAKQLTVSSGGYAVVSNDGMIAGGTIDAGGIALALQGATLEDVTVESGGHLIETPGASIVSASGVVISKGVALVENGNFASSFAVGAVDLNLGSGGTAFILDGGSVHQLR